MTVELVPARDDEREIFIRNLQAAFKQGATEEGFGGDEVISREDVIATIDVVGAQILNIVRAGTIVGGAVVVIRPNNRNELALLYISVDCHDNGIGAAAWRAIEARYPQTEVWEAMTPYFAKRNLHFYINKCGFHAVEFFSPRHPSPDSDEDLPDGEYGFRFEKVMSK